MKYTHQLYTYLLNTTYTIVVAYLGQRQRKRATNQCGLSIRSLNKRKYWLHWYKSDQNASKIEFTVTCWILHTINIKVQTNTLNWWMNDVTFFSDCFKVTHVYFFIFQIKPIHSYHMRSVLWHGFHIMYMMNILRIGMYKLCLKQWI